MPASGVGTWVPPSGGTVDEVGRGRVPGQLYRGITGGNTAGSTSPPLGEHWPGPIWLLTTLPGERRGRCRADGCGAAPDTRSPTPRQAPGSGSAARRFAHCGHVAPSSFAPPDDPRVALLNPSSLRPASPWRRSARSYVRHLASLSLRWSIAEARPRPRRNDQYLRADPVSRTQQCVVNRYRRASILYTLDQQKAGLCVAGNGKWTADTTIFSHSQMNSLKAAERLSCRLPS